MKIALLQIVPCGTLEGNLEKGIASCRKAKGLGADIALFPEMRSNGYHIYDRPVDQWKAEAILADSEFVNAFGRLAKELSMTIGITFLERHEGGPHNSMVLFDQHGERKITYAKVHTCNYPDSVPDCNGGSSVFDGVAYLPELDGSRDTCILQADGTEGVYLAELDLAQLQRYREHEVHGNAFRRPQKYGLLLDTKIEPPFIRDRDRR